MREIRFPYLKFLVTPPPVKPAEYIYRPVIPVSLSLHKNSVIFEALVDSGADENTFPGWVANKIGLDVYKGKQKIFSGIGGSVLAYLHKTTLNISGVQFTSDIYYSHEWDDMPFGLLGQAGFFSHFTVQFNYKQKKLLLKH